MLLDCTDASHVLYILVKFWIDSHVLSTDSKSLFVLVFVCDAYYKWDTGRIFLHNFKHEPYCQMYTFNHEWLIPFLEIVDYLFKFVLNLGALNLIADQGFLFLGLDIFSDLAKLDILTYKSSSLIGRCENDGIIFFRDKVSHYMADRVCWYNSWNSKSTT